MFGEAIKNIITAYEGPLLYIKKHPQKCICTTHINEADVKCPLCLGTGYKISIKAIKGAVQDSNGTATMRSGNDFIIAKEIFIRSEYAVSSEDFIIFEDFPYEIYAIKSHRLTENKLVYTICYCVPKKYDVNIFMTNFYKLLPSRK